MPTSAHRMALFLNRVDVGIDPYILFHFKKALNG